MVQRVLKTSAAETISINFKYYVAQGVPPSPNPISACVVLLPLSTDLVKPSLTLYFELARILTDLAWFELTWLYFIGFWTFQIWPDVICPRQIWTEYILNKSDLIFFFWEGESSTTHRPTECPDVHTVVSGVGLSPNKTPLFITALPEPRHVGITHQHSVLITGKNGFDLMWFNLTLFDLVLFGPISPDLTPPDLS